MIKTETLEKYNKKYFSSENNGLALDLSSLSVASGQSLQIKITLISLVADSDLYVTVSNSEITGISVSSAVTMLEKNVGQKVSTGKSSVLEVNVSNTASTTISLASLSAGITFTDAPTPNALQSATDLSGQTYYYVEMGEDYGTKIRWRYIPDGNGRPFDGAKPTSEKGYYILETPIFCTMLYFLEMSADGVHLPHTAYTLIYAHDYATSDMHRYLSNGDFMTDFLIDTEDPIYKMITPRSMVDLYSEIKLDGTAISQTEAKYGLSIEDLRNQEVKFWLPSYLEIKDMICGGTWDNNKALWMPTPESGDSEVFEYWLRTPGTEATDYACYIDQAGDLKSIGVTNILYGAFRPCFYIG